MADVHFQRASKSVISLCETAEAEYRSHQFRRLRRRDPHPGQGESLIHLATELKHPEDSSNDPGDAPARSRRAKTGAGEVLLQQSRAATNDRREKMAWQDQRTQESLSLPTGHTTTPLHAAHLVCNLSAVLSCFVVLIEVCSSPPESNQSKNASRIRKINAIGPQVAFCGGN